MLCLPTDLVKEVLYEFRTQKKRKLNVPHLKLLTKQFIKIMIFYFSFLIKTINKNKNKIINDYCFILNIYVFIIIKLILIN
jgi:hypothetical protein